MLALLHHNRLKMTADFKKETFGLSLFWPQLRDINSHITNANARTDKSAL